MFTQPVLPATHPPTAIRARQPGPDKAAMHKRIDALEAEVHALRGQIDGMHASTSWRVSAPLRLLSRFVQRLRRGAIHGSYRRADTYAEWVRLYDTPAPQVKEETTELPADGRQRELHLHVLLLANGVDAAQLSDSIKSLHAQEWRDWQLTVLVGPTEADAVRAAIQDSEDSRIEVSERSPTASVAEVCNRAVAGLQAGWVVLMTGGDVLPSYALAHVAAEVRSHAAARLVYADDDRIGADGVRCEPHFKPDWNVDMFYVQDIVSRFCALDARLLHEAGGFGEGFGAAMVYELLLRCLERLAPGDGIRHIPRVLCHVTGRALHGSQVDALAETEAIAVDQHFRRIGTPARAMRCEQGRRVRYELPDAAPLVTLIIPTRNAVALLRQCIGSIVTATTYPNYELLLIDNGSDDGEALTYLASLEGQPGIRVLRDNRPFNYSALNNMGVANARGSVIGLVNNDIEVISPGWLDEMVSIALQPGVGAVGAKLLYPDERVQHGGVLLGVGGVEGVAGHANKFLPAWHGGYMGRASMVQSFSAVTAACLVVRKAAYEQVGGLDEVELKVAYNDIDFCLRLRGAGYRNVWTPHAELFHHESATRGADIQPAQRARFDQEHAYMRRRWADVLAADPAYNPNLTVHAENFGLAWPPRVPWIQGAARP